MEVWFIELFHTDSMNIMGWMASLCVFRTPEFYFRMGRSFITGIYITIICLSPKIIVNVFAKQKCATFLIEKCMRCFLSFLFTTSTPLPSSASKFHSIPLSYSLALSNMFSFPTSLMLHVPQIPLHSCHSNSFPTSLISTFQKKENKIG